MKTQTVIALLLAFWVFYNVGADAYAIYQIKKIEWSAEKASFQYMYLECYNSSTYAEMLPTRRHAYCTRLAKGKMK